LQKLPSLADENPSQRSLAARDFNRFCKIAAGGYQVVQKRPVAAPNKWTDGTTGTPPDG
jgi:hypothetical protein